MTLHVPLSPEKRAYLVDWLGEQDPKRWHPDTAGLYIDFYSEGGLDHELLGQPAHDSIARALCNYHAGPTIDSWLDIAPHVREHLRERALFASGLEAIRLGVTLDALAALIGDVPPPEAGRPGTALRPTALAD